MHYMDCNFLDIFLFGGCDSPVTCTSINRLLARPLAFAPMAISTSIAASLRRQRSESTVSKAVFVLSVTTHIACVRGLVASVTYPVILLVPVVCFLWLWLMLYASAQEKVAVVVHQGAFHELLYNLLYIAMLTFLFIHGIYLFQFDHTSRTS
jgi:large-conductance mechanosensitive channel